MMQSSPYHDLNATTSDDFVRWTFFCVGENAEYGFDQQRLIFKTEKVDF